MKNATANWSMLATVDKLLTILAAVLMTAGCALMVDDHASDTEMVISLPDGVTIDYRREKNDLIMDTKDPCDEVLE